MASGMASASLHEYGKMLQEQFSEEEELLKAGGLLGSNLANEFYKTHLYEADEPLKSGGLLGSNLATEFYEPDDLLKAGGLLGSSLAKEFHEPDELLKGGGFLGSKEAKFHEPDELQKGFLQGGGMFESDDLLSDGGLRGNKLVNRAELDPIPKGGAGWWTQYEDVQGQILELSSSTEESSRLVQVVWQSEMSDEQRIAFASELKGHIVAKSRCRHANFVIQKLMQSDLLSREVNQFVLGMIIEEIDDGGSTAVDLAMDQYAYKVLQRLFERASAQQVEGIFNALLGNVVELCKRNNSRFVLITILEGGDVHKARRICEHLDGHVSNICQNDDGCAVLEKAIRTAHPGLHIQKTKLANELLVTCFDMLANMACQRFGHSALLAALKAPGTQCSAAVRAAESKLSDASAQLKLNRFGKKVLEALAPVQVTGMTSFPAYCGEPSTQLPAATQISISAPAYIECPPVADHLEGVEPLTAVRKEGQSGHETIYWVVSEHQLRTSGNVIPLSEVDILLDESSERAVPFRMFIRAKQQVGKNNSSMSRSKGCGGTIDIKCMVPAASLEGVQANISYRLVIGNGGQIPSVSDSHNFAVNPVCSIALPDDQNFKQVIDHNKFVIRLEINPEHNVDGKTLVGGDTNPSLVNVSDGECRSEITHQPKLVPSPLRTGCGGHPINNWEESIVKDNLPYDPFTHSGTQVPDSCSDADFPGKFGGHPPLPWGLPPGEAEEWLAGWHLAQYKQYSWMAQMNHFTPPMPPNMGDPRGFSGMPLHYQRSPFHGASHKRGLAKQRDHASEPLTAEGARDCFLRHWQGESRLDTHCYNKHPEAAMSPSLTPGTLYDAAAIMENLSAGNIQRLSQDKEGCRHVQNQLDLTTNDEDCFRLADGLQHHVVELAKCPNGSHVIQKFIEKLHPQKLEFFLAEISGHALSIVKNQYAYRVLQRMFEHFSPVFSKQVGVIVNELLVESIVTSLKHTNYQYVMQSVLEHGPPESVNAVVELLTKTENANALCKNAHGCALFGVVLELDDETRLTRHARLALADELLRTENIETLLGAIDPARKDMQVLRHGKGRKHYISSALLLSRSSGSEQWKEALSVLRWYDNEKETLAYHDKLEQTRYGRVLIRDLEEFAQSEAPPGLEEFGQCQSKDHIAVSLDGSDITWTVPSHKLNSSDRQIMSQLFKTPLCNKLTGFKMFIRPPQGKDKVQHAGSDDGYRIELKCQDWLGYDTANRFEEAKLQCHVSIYSGDVFLPETLHEHDFALSATGCFFEGSFRDIVDKKAVENDPSHTFVVRLKVELKIGSN